MRAVDPSLRESLPPVLSTVSSEPDPDRSYSELLADTLDAIRAGDQDREMANRAELIGRFKRRDERIDAGLFDLLTEQITGKPAGTTPTAPSVDLDAVDAIDALIDGFVPQHDLALLYGEKGTGKTMAALEMAFAVIDGRGFLDHDRPAPKGKVLFIASDSGAAPLKSALQDLGFIDHPAIRRGPEQRFFVWAAAPDQGHTGWAATINGCVKLHQFIRAEGISLVVVDSAKMICSKANLAYTDNIAVTAFLGFLKEAICPHSSVVIINHDGREKGSHSGAKAWAEIPSVVHSITHARNPDERLWTVVKSRMGPRRQFNYRQVESGRLEPAAGVEQIGDAAEAIVQILTEAAGRGIDSTSRGELVSEIGRRFGLAPKTVDNTLGRMVRESRPAICRCSGRIGRYKLSPAAAARLPVKMRAQTGRKESKPLAGTDFSPFPAGFHQETLGTSDHSPREVPGNCLNPSQEKESPVVPSHSRPFSHAREAQAPGLRTVAEWVDAALDGLRLAPHPRFASDVIAWLTSNGAPAIAQNVIASHLQALADEEAEQYVLELI